MKKLILITLFLCSSAFADKPIIGEFYTIHKECIDGYLYYVLVDVWGKPVQIYQPTEKSKGKYVDIPQPIKC